jgi:3-oxoacyl-[acyl-carrier protein] reductase
MNLGLAGKIALVTGSSSGIGAATAQILAEEGANVVVCYGNNRAGAEQTQKTIESAGRRAWLCPMDLSQPGQVVQAAKRIQDSVSALDILVLCAGQNIVTPFEAITPEEWGKVIEVNLSGAFYVIQAFSPLLREGGAVVTVASVAAHTGAPHHAHYAAAKAGLVNLTKSAARALAPRVRVNCVAPGITLTPMGQETADTLEPGYAEKKILLQRFAAPEEIARWIVFVASPAAGFMTGATIDVNGGRDLR